MDTEVDVGKLELVWDTLGIDRRSMQPESDFYSDRGFVTTRCHAGWFAEAKESGFFLFDACFSVADPEEQTRVDLPIRAWKLHDLEGVRRRIVDLDLVIEKLIRFRNAAAGNFNKIVIDAREKAEAQPAQDQSQDEQVQ